MHPSEDLFEEYYWTSRLTPETEHGRILVNGKHLKIFTYWYFAFLNKYIANRLNISLFSWTAEGNVEDDLYDEGMMGTDWEVVFLNNVKWAS